MLEDIMIYYRRMCTCIGQFDIVLNTWLLLIIIFGIGGLIELTIFIKLDSLSEIYHYSL